MFIFDLWEKEGRRRAGRGKQKDKKEVRKEEGRKKGGRKERGRTEGMSEGLCGKTRLRLNQIFPPSSLIFRNCSFRVFIQQ